MPSENLTFSIITPTLNAEKTLEDTMRSVRCQTYPWVEHVIIDGGSRDSTIDIVKEHMGEKDHFISEPDHGLYDAMNKGIKTAKGNILFFLNADDRFCDDRVLEDVARVFMKNTDTSIVFGNIIWDLSGNLVQTKQSRHVTRQSLARQTVFHQTVFCKNEVFETTGPFSLCYRIVSDYEWMLKIFLREKFKYAYLDRDITVVGTEGKSNTSGFELERLRLMTQYYGLHEILKHRVWPMRKRYLFNWLKNCHLIPIIDFFSPRKSP